VAKFVCKEAPFQQAMEGKLLISVCAGLKIAQLKEMLPKSCNLFVLKRAFDVYYHF
jgi:pyrroline-5-carboxylate reductase